MVFINEFLPNPSGSDTENEWVELFNDGFVPINLSGWTLATKGGKKFVLGGKTAGAGEYLLLPRSETKLTLHNTDGALALYDALGELVDEAQFFGTAPEGKSFARTRNDDLSRAESRDDHEGVFAFADPTPGAKNIATNHLTLVAKNYPFGQPLNPPLGAPEIFGIALGGAALLAMLVLIVFKKNESFSKLFFEKN